MRIAIDARAPNIGGIRSYATDLLEHLVPLLRHHELHIFYDKNQGTGYYPNVIENTVPSLHPVYWALWSHTFLPAYLKRHRINLFHSLKHPVALLSTCKKVSTIHDASFFVVPDHGSRYETLYWRTMLRWAAYNSDVVLTLSHSAKVALLPCLNIPEWRIEVAYPGCHPRFSQPHAGVEERRIIRDKYRLPERFFFWLGVMAPNKNLPFLIRAFARAGRETLIRQHLVLAGPQNQHMKELLEVVAAESLQERVHFLGIIPEDDLPVLYQIADALVFPSTHEGFGLPIVEAMACGTPVITSNAASCPEVVGNAGLVVDPVDSAGLAQALAEIASDHELRQQLIAKGLQRAQRFSYSQTAQKIFEIYQKLLGSAGTDQRSVDEMI